MAIGVSGFPGSLDTLTELIRAVNDANTTIGAGGATDSATTINVTSAASAPTNGKAVIVSASDDTVREIVTFTGKTGTSITGVTRNVESSGAKTWLAGDLVYFDGITALNHNVLAAAIVAIEANLGLVLIADQDFSGVSTVSVDGVFSSLYDHYDITIGPFATSAAQNLLMQLRSGGSNATGTDYYSGIQLVTPANESYNTGGAGVNSWIVFSAAGATITDARVDLQVGRPAAADQTLFSMVGAGRYVTNMVAEHGGGMHNLTTAYDGFRLFVASGTISGTVRVYGRRQS